ncbi:MAG: ankyrin repeat domain-containing protein [Bacteroidota bacterium]
MFVLLIKASLVLVILLAFYKLLLEKESFFAVNRIYLLAVLIFALALPFITLPKLVEHQGYLAQWMENTDKENLAIDDETVTTLPKTEPFEAKIDADDLSHSERSEAIIAVQADQRIDSNVSATGEVAAAENTAAPATTRGIGFWLLVLYGFGVGVLTLNFLAQILGTLIKAIRNEDKIQDEVGTIVNLETESEPCSFFKYIFIHPDSYDFDTYEQIIAHEKVHVKQWHSLDLMLAEIAVILLWFNPFVWWFRKEVEKNIEYQTDDLLTQQEPQAEKKGYQLNLLKIATHNKPLTITTNYNQSLIKQRILKMNTKKSNPYSYWKYAFVAPLVFVLLLMLNQPSSLHAIETNKSMTTTLNVQTGLMEKATVQENVSNTISEHNTAAISQVENSRMDNSDCKKLLKAAEKEDIEAIKKILKSFDLSCAPSTDAGDAGNFEYLRRAITNDAKVTVNQQQKTITVISNEPSETGGMVETVATIDLEWIAGKTPRIGKDYHTEIGIFDIEKDYSNNGRNNDCKQLIRAILSEDIVSVKELIATTDVNCIDPKPDHKEMKEGNSRYYYLDPRTPLVAAARIGNLEIGKLLVAAGAKVDFQAPRDETPIMAAAESNALDFVKFLHQKGADINKKQRGEGSVLSVAARSGSLDVVKYLLAEGADIQANVAGEGTPLSVASRSGHLEVVKYLLSKGADINSDTRGEGTPLSVAARSGHLPVVKYLLDKGANINAQSIGEGTPLSVAARSGHLPVVEYLLSRGADINTDSRGEGTPLSVAARSGHLAVVKFLLSKGADINADSRGEGTPLSVAARSGHLEVVKYLITQKADINAESVGEGTPLSVAARSGHLPVVKYLLSQGADINAEAQGEGTPLSVAARSGHLPVVTFLLDKGADIEASARGEGTPLTVAARSGHLAVVKFLVQKGADLNSNTLGEGTPLFVAARSGHRDVVDYLKAQGAEF